MDEGDISTVSTQGNNHLEEARSESKWAYMDPKLLEAAINGDMDLLDAFLQNRPDLNSVAINFNPLECNASNRLRGVPTGGNTALHIVASSSNIDDAKRPLRCYLDFAEKIFVVEPCLLIARNKLLETPLHCATKLGSFEMVCLLISLAEKEKQVGEKNILVRARNIHGETALHEAVRRGNKDMVEKLISTEPELASIVDEQGVSPLYLATMTNSFEIVQIFVKGETSMVSFAGPEGRTALHASVLEHKEITRELLNWNQILATKIDKLGSTPLHYAASAGNLEITKLLLHYDSSAAYIPDNKGMYPIHVAAIMGYRFVIEELLNQFPNSYELLHKEEKNFLHVAVVNRRVKTIQHLMKHSMFSRMANATDVKGYTALHLAVEIGCYGIVRALVSSKSVYLNIMNKEGLTPVDLATKKIERGLVYMMSTEINILRCLLWTGALPSPSRSDYLFEAFRIPDRTDTKELKKYESSARYSSLVSVLIATVTFAAIFTMPGGYIADDHAHKGSPVMFRRYAFKAFIVSNTLAFIFSILTTIWLMYAGTIYIDTRLRYWCLVWSSYLMEFATKALVSAFALGMYVVLAPVNLPMGVLLCVLIFTSLLVINPFVLDFLFLWKPLLMRVGFIAMFKSCCRPQTKRRLLASIGNISSFLSIFINLFLFGLIFLFALV